MVQEITPSLTNHIQVELSESDGNAYSILGRCQKALKRSNVDNKNEIWNFIYEEATSGDYNHLIQTMMKWFDVS